ncbi:MAG TPA: LysR family transcriptional regulator [Vicinamibacterales bacterium]|nr:LysR family transcriptional regulator [Vicinamibacterales bacterium]
MDLLQLEHFLAVVEEGTFTRAAERVGRSQPAVSQSIKKLEEEIGAPLFARDMHEACLTEAGKLLVDYSRRMLALRDEALRRLGQRSPGAGSLAIAAHEAAAVYLLPGPLRVYLERFPDVKVAIYRSRLSEIPRQVMDREVDVGFVKEEPAFHELRWIHVYSDELILVASPRHPLARRRSVRIRDLAGEPFIFHHLCAATEQAILRLFAQHGARCNVVAELWSFENIKDFVKQEIGVAIVPRVTAAAELRDRVLVQVPVPELRIARQTYMIFRDPDYLSQPARELVSIVRSFDWKGPRPAAPDPADAVASAAAPQATVLSYAPPGRRR